MKTLIQTKAQRRCGKREHGWVVNTCSGEIVSGCVYCGYNPGSLAVCTVSRPIHALDVVSSVAVIACLLAIAYVGTVAAVWLSGAL